MAGGMPNRCQVVGISPFMRSLIAEALDLPVAYDPDSRAGALMALIQHEMGRLPVLAALVAIPGAWSSGPAVPSVSPETDGT